MKPINIILKSYTKGQKVEVTYFYNWWKVMQDKELIMYCSHLYLREVSFLKGGLITGFIVHQQELEKLHNEICKDDNSCFPYFTVDLVDGVFYQNGKRIESCPYLDMIVTENPKLLAVYPGKEIWGMT